jgi:hypothetical protein
LAKASYCLSSVDDIESFPAISSTFASQPAGSPFPFRQSPATWEALFGAIYLDQGFEKARELAERVLFSQ